MSKRYHLRGGGNALIGCIICDAPFIVTDIGNDKFKFNHSCICQNRGQLNTIYTRTWLEDVALLELIPIKGRGFNPFKKWKAKVRK